MAAQKGHVQIVQTLLTRDDIDVNKHNKKNQTPLNIASDNGHVEVVRLLLSQPNIDLNKKDDWGTTALGIAKEKNHTEVVQLLTEAGAEYSIGAAIGCNDVDFVKHWSNDDGCSSMTPAASVPIPSANRLSTKSLLSCE